MQLIDRVVQFHTKCSRSAAFTPTLDSEFEEDARSDVVASRLAAWGIE